MLFSLCLNTISNAVYFVIYFIFTTGKNLLVTVVDLVSDVADLVVAVVTVVLTPSGQLRY